MGTAWGYWSHNQLYPTPSCPVALHLPQPGSSQLAPLLSGVAQQGSHSDQTSRWGISALLPSPNPHTLDLAQLGLQVPQDLKPSGYADQAPRGPTPRWFPPLKPRVRTQNVPVVETPCLTPIGAQALPHLSCSGGSRG